jgi:hypothetical protein
MGDGQDITADASEPPRSDAVAKTGDTGGAGLSLSAAGGRIQELLRTTEETADGILKAAEEEAQLHVDEARQSRELAEQEVARDKAAAKEKIERVTKDRLDRIAALSQELVTHAEGASRQASQLTLALGAAADALVAELGLEPDTPAPEQAPRATEQETLSEVGGESLTQRFRRFLSTEPSEGEEPKRLLRPAELAAMQMIAAGEDRAAVERCMREEFGVEDPATLVDELPLDRTQIPR